MRLVTVKVHGDEYIGWMVAQYRHAVVLEAYSVQYELDGLYVPPHADDAVEVPLGDYTIVTALSGAVLYKGEKVQ